MATFNPIAVVGMTSLATSTASLLTGTSTVPYIIRTIHADTQSTGKNFTFSIGADGIGTRLFDAYVLSANVPSIFNGWWVKVGSGSAHDLDGNCNSATVTFMASGYNFS